MTMSIKCSILFESVNCPNRHAKPVQGIVSLGRHRTKGKDGKPDKYLLLIKTTSSNCPKSIEISRLRSTIKTMLTNGKATLQFGDPGCNLFLSKAEPEKLRKLLLHIRSATSKDAPDDFLNEINSKENFELDINAPVSAPSKTKLKVSTRSDYPNNFPQTLISLQMTGIRLKDIDLRWFRLKALRHLDLSENRLGTIRTPAQWQKFYMIESLENLEELILHRNAFSGFPIKFYESLPRSLKLLDLSFNDLTCLCDKIAQLRSLITLKIEGNQIEQLPSDICLMPKLLNIYASKNKLIFLPGTLFTNRKCNNFNTLDFSDQQVPNEYEFFVPILPSVPALSVISAATILNNNKLFSPNVLKHICLPEHVLREARTMLTKCVECWTLYYDKRDSAETMSVSLSAYATNSYSHRGARHPVIFFLCKLCQQRHRV